MAGESLNGEIFDGKTEAAVFPGHLPEDPRQIFQGQGLGLSEGETDMRFLRFRPPLIAPGTAFPHIRLDRAMEFLFGDKL